MGRVPWRLVVGTAVLVSGAARAELHIEPALAQAGTVRRGPPLSRTFTLTNRGAAPVEIIGARAGCGCLTPRIDRRTLAPGESAPVVLEVNTLSQAAGEHTWACQVYYQSGGQPSEAMLRVSGRVLAEVTVEPTAVTLSATGAVRREILLTDHRARPLTVTAARGSSPHLRAEVRPPHRDERGQAAYRIELELTADCPEGRHEEVLSLYTDDPSYAELKVPVTVHKRARQRVTASPPEVTLTADAASRLVLLRDADDQPVVVEGVTADDPAVVCRAAQGQNGPAAVRVSVDRGRVAGKELRTAVRVRVIKPAAQTVVVPVTFNLP